jgi:hypothetical protein
MWQSSTKKTNRTKKKIVSEFKMGTYLYGKQHHTSKIENTIGYFNNNILYISSELFHDYFSIHSKHIKGVSVENKSSIEKKVTFKRLMLLGVFAFAFKKDIENEVGFLVIEYTESDIPMEIIFQFDGKGAMSKAVEARIAILKGLNNSPKNYLDGNSQTPIY